jgi:Cu(I)/Ag(I) efflux system membrane fusion protein
MKKYSFYIVSILVGLLLGWFFFGNTSNEDTSHNHEESSKTNQQWTCSMHPQIMQPEAGDCPICGMDLILAETTADGLDANQFTMSKNAIAIANIQTSKVENVTIGNDVITLSGEIVVNKDATATQPAHLNGRIEKLYITSVGQQVKIGDRIAEIYSPELVVAQQELIAAYNVKRAQPELYKSVRRKFQFWKIKEEQLSEIEKNGKVKMAFTIYSHVTGTVTDISVNVGAHIMDGRPIFKVSNLNSVWAEFDLNEKQIPAVKAGEQINITTSTQEKIKAKISFIDPVLNTETRTVIARAVLKNTHKRLKPGMFIKGNLISKTLGSNQKMTVPKTAVLWTGKRSLVYVKVPNESVFEMRSVELGITMGKNYEVISGLNFGEEIVVNGTFTVDAAAQLLGKKSMMTATVVLQDKIEIERIAVDVNFQNQLQVVVANYLELKNEFVLSKTEKTTEIVSKISTSIKKVDMNLLKDPAAHKLWMNLLKEINSSVNLMNSSREIKTQRIAFIQLSSAMINSVKAFGINKKIYNQFCPMANNDKGANWLSFQENIKNPYFGDAMLTCGNVEETIN